MCGRYTLSIPLDVLEERFHATSALERYTPNYNVAPSQVLPVILSTTPEVITAASWGFLPEWAEGKAAVKPVINARADSVATKPFFRRAFRSKRCLVLADGFYEWQRMGKHKIPYRIAFKSKEPFAFAGLWSTVHSTTQGPQTTFALLTTEANALMAPIHHRMPVILPAHNEARWLDPACAIESLQELLVPFSADLLIAYAVSPQVNSSAYNTPEALHPLDTPSPVCSS